MFRIPGYVLLAAMLGLNGGSPAAPVVTDGPSYTAEGQLKYPEHYREWVFLTSGLDMSYDPKPGDAAHSVFDNVFVNPGAYRVFQQTGHWPEGTEFVLENRGAEASKSINKAGKTQSLEVTGTEVHVLDSAHLDPQHKNDGWGFYAFKDHVSAKLLERPKSCYTCHEEHAAVDTTFVQFYPTLQKAAEANRSYSAKYLKEMEPPAK